MARNITRRGRMKLEHETRIQINSLYIEQEVDGQHLAAFLYASGAIDNDERDAILGERTPKLRTRKMISILLQRGPGAFEKFLNALDRAGYDHVAKRLRNMEVTMIQMSPHSSVQDSRSSPARQILDTNLVEQLQTTKQHCEGLSRRMTRLENWVKEKLVSPGANGGDTAMGQTGEEELNGIKKELTELKKDTIAQIEELTSANIQKDAIIENLKVQLDQKTADLQEAKSRVEALEKRIKQLETEKAKFMKDMKDKIQQQEDKIQQQEDKIQQQEDTMKQQGDTMKQQGDTIKQQGDTIKQQGDTMEKMQQEKNLMKNTIQQQGGAIQRIQEQLQRQATSASPRKHRNFTKETQKSGTSFNPVTRTSQNMSTVYPKSTNKNTYLPPICKK